MWVAGARLLHPVRVIPTQMGETGHGHVEGPLVGGVGPVLPAGVEEDVLHMTWGVRPDRKSVV